MKKLFFTLSIVSLMAVASHAQIGKGAVLVGASSNLGFTSYKPDQGDSYSAFNIDGKVGYFVIDNLALGVNLGYAKVDDFTSTSFGAFGRYYVNGKIILGAGFTSNKSETDGSDDFSYTTIPLEVGYAAFINKFIAVEPVLKYELWSGDAEGSAFGLGVGFTLYLNRGE